MPQLRLIHIALCLSAAVLTVTLGSLRSFGPGATEPLPPILSWTLLGLAAMTILTAATIRTGLVAARTDEQVESWIATNRTKCVTLWAILEGGVALCAVALFLGADPWAAGALAAGGLGFLASQSPGTLAGH